MTLSATNVDASSFALNVRQARSGDVSAIWGLLEENARKGLLLPRTLDDIHAAIGEFQVAEASGEIRGCVSLHPYGERLAEIRSLAVAPQHRSQGIGRELVLGVIDKAVELQLPRLFTLTFQKEFFQRLGFVWYDKKLLPEKIWRDCIGCVHFPVCAEEAFVMDAPFGN